MKHWKGLMLHRRVGGPSSRDGNGRRKPAMEDRVIKKLGHVKSNEGMKALTR